MRAAQFLDRSVGQVLHPPLQAVRAGDLVVRVVVEQVRHLAGSGPGLDAPADLPQLGVDAQELLPPPGIRLFEIDRGAEEVADASA